MIAKSSSTELVQESRVYDFKASGLRFYAHGLILLSINMGAFSYPIICSQGELQGVHHEAESFGFISRQQ